MQEATSLFAQNAEAETSTDLAAEVLAQSEEVTQNVEPVEEVAPEVAQAATPVGATTANPYGEEAPVDAIVASIPDNLTYEQMEAARRALAEKMAAARDAQRAADLNTVKVLVARHGFSAGELHLSKGKAKNKTGKTVAPKYRNPENPEQVWTGRGVAPTWIRDVPKDQRDSYLIPQA